MLRVLHRPLLVLDGAFFAHRAYHASHAAPAEVFVDTVLRVIADEQPDYLACAWDAEGPNYRHTLYADYKANRPEKDPALVDHLRACHAALEAMGVPVYEASGFEGDDVVATLTRRWTRRGGRVRVHTADKDILQLVDEDTTVVLRGQVFRHDDVVERYGITPAMVPAFLALAGDSADGIPGIPGIGPTTAAKLLMSFGSLDAILEAAPSCDERRARALVGREDQARLFHSLTVLHEDAPLPVEDDDLVCHVHPGVLAHPELPEAARRHAWSLECYRERAVIYEERVAMMRESIEDQRVLRREARRCAGRVPVQRGY